MNCNTKVSDCSHKEIKRVVELTFDWCVNNMGVRKNKGIPELKVSKKKFKKDPYYGCYVNLSHKITIYPETFKEWNNTLRKVIGIVIHEYCHTLQKGGDKLYLKYSKKYGYWDNPFEVEARRAEKDWVRCYREIKHEI